MGSPAVKAIRSRRSRRSLDAVPTVRAIKDWCSNPQLHERHIRVLQSRTPPVNVLTTHSTWLMGSLVLGCNGLLSGSGSVIADLHVQLWRAVQENDLAAARRVNDRIWPRPPRRSTASLRSTCTTA